MGHYLVPLAVAFVIGLIMTPLARRLGFLIGAVDRPGGRRINKRPTPRTGGLAIYIAFMVAFALGLPHDRSWTGIALGLSGAFLLGFLDDIFDLKPLVKLAGQLAVAALLVAYGVRIRCLTDPRGGFLMIGFWGIPLTLVWIVGMMNMINLIDGLDGLAAGIVVIASCALFFVALGKGQALAAALCAMVVGSACGFLVYNFNPARVFMGDGGALFLGCLLGVISVQGALKSATAVALAVPLTAVGLPFLDTVLAVWRRVRAGRSMLSADREHLHHRLLDLGMSQRQAVLSLYVVSAVLGVVAVVAALSGVPLGTILLPVVLLSVLYIGHRAGIFAPTRLKR